MKPHVRPDLIPIDQLAQDAVALSARRDKRQACEVFHCSGGLGDSSHAIMACFAEAAGIDISFGPPVTSRELKFARVIELNMPFANTEWEFGRQQLDLVLGRSEPPQALTLRDMARLAEWHLADEAPAAITFRNQRPARVPVRQ